MCAKLDGLILVLVFRSVSIHGLGLSILSVDFANYNTFSFMKFCKLQYNPQKSSLWYPKQKKTKAIMLKTKFSTL